MNDTSERDPALLEAAKACGGIVAMSLALGKSRGAVSQWKRVPAEEVLQVERLTGVSRYRLRPDIFGPAPSNQEAAA